LLSVTEGVMGIILDRLTTVEEFESLANNVQKSNPVLAREVRRRGVELRSAAHGAKTVAQGSETLPSALCPKKLKTK
jgi:hypothetical protein